MTYSFTSKAKKSIDIANGAAVELGSRYIGTEHILYGLVEEGTGVAAQTLALQDITSDYVLVEIVKSLGRNTPVSETYGFTPEAKKLIEDAAQEALNFGLNYIGTEHLLLAMIKNSNSIAAQILINLHVNLAKLYNEIISTISAQGVYGAEDSKVQNSKNQEIDKTPTLNQFGTDLTKKAADGLLDPVIGRSKEVARVIQILSRRTKNNPVLIGEPGVGKTAIVEGLAQRIVAGDVPENLIGKRLVTLDLTSMVAGSKYRGDFEERIKKAFDEVKNSNNVILFLDEIHTIVGTGSAEGSMDAANILKPMLARGEIRLIGATTINEYRKQIEKDAALERRFSPVMVEEPSQEDALTILKGLRDKYEAHHNVKISDDALEDAIKMASRYINDRFLPDKAIDLIDEAASRARLESYIEPTTLKEIHEQIEQVDKNKLEAVNSQEFEQAAKLRDEEKKLKKKYKEEKEKWHDKQKNELIQITPDDIAAVISLWTGIPAQKLTQDENEKLKNLTNILHKRVVGQNEAVDAVSRAIKRGRVGLKDPNRPIGSFLFLGPTGVGKTELSKALSEALFGSSDSMIRLDMSEFMEAHSVSKLIGSPPGYVGFDDGGQLTEKIRRKPYSVVLFDEIEKAHPDVMNMLLQILDDGRLTDSHGRVVSFKDTVIIMTSNIGAKIITNEKPIGFSPEEQEDDKVVKEQKDYEQIKKEVTDALKHEFRPEFLNRIDEIIVFHKLNDEEIYDIIKILLNNVLNRLAQEEYDVEFDDTVNQLIADVGIDKNYGARPLRRAIQTHIEDKLAEEILNGNLQKFTKTKVGAKDGKIYIKSPETSIKTPSKQENVEEPKKDTQPKEKKTKKTK